MGDWYEETSVRGPLRYSSSSFAAAASTTAESHTGTRERENRLYILAGPVRSLSYAYSRTYLGLSWTFLREDAGEREVSYKLAPQYADKLVPVVSIATNGGS